MKIIVIVDSLDLELGGGVGSFIYELYHEICKNHEVYFIGIVNNIKEDDSLLQSLRDCSIKTYCIGAPSRKDALIKFLYYKQKLHSLIKKISDEEPTICNTHLKMGTLFGSFASNGLQNVRVIETYHSRYHHYYLQYQLMKKLISKYICCSDSARSEFIDRFHPDRSKAITINNGINIDEIQKTYFHPTQKQTNSIVLLSVGRLTKQKNFKVVIDAINHLSHGIKYLIIGDGEDAQTLHNLVRNQNIYLLGAQSRTCVFENLNAASFVIMPSLWEGLSIFLLEAMALGKPLMLSDIASFRNMFNEDALTTNENYRVCPWGYLVKNNSISWEQAIKHAMLNQELISGMGNRVLSISENYSIVKTSASYIDVFEEVLSAE